jgi:nitrite reductase (NADH) small subunit/3-phenylpropionate/trans-cinnamate dioxygenase ferredoxin subunit
MAARAVRIQVKGEAMAEFQTVCTVADVPEGGGKAVAVGDRLVAVFKQGGELHAIDDTCPHMGASLAAGQLEHGVVTCPWHAWRFRVTDGTWADNPRVKIPCHAVRVVGDEVQVQRPEPKPPRHPPTPGGPPS